MASRRSSPPPRATSSTCTRCRRSIYAGTAIAFAAGESGSLLVGLGWAYVALRALHSAIHVTNNKVMWRFRAFFASWVVLLAYWAVLGTAIARGPAAG